MLLAHGLRVVAALGFLPHLETGPSGRVLPDVGRFLLDACARNAYTASLMFMIPGMSSSSIISFRPTSVIAFSRLAAKSKVSRP